jgi:hypothetical protein
MPKSKALEQEVFTENKIIGIRHWHPGWPKVAENAGKKERRPSG